MANGPRRGAAKSEFSADINQFHEGPMSSALRMCFGPPRPEPKEESTPDFSFATDEEREQAQREFFASRPRTWPTEEPLRYFECDSQEARQQLLHALFLQRNRGSPNR